MTGQTTTTTTTNPYTAPVDPNAGSPLGNESSLSNWAGDYVTDMLGRGAALADQPYYAYQGPLTPGISSLQDQAFSGIAGLSVPAGSAEAANKAGQIGNTMQGMSFDPSTFSTSQWTDPGMAQSYMNPYVQNALTPQMDEMRRQAEITRLNDASRYTKAGAYGGSRQAISESEGWDNMARLMNETTGKGYMDAYNTGSGIFASDKDRMLRADGMTDASRQFGASFGLDAQRGALDAAKAQGSLSGSQLDDALQLLQQQKAFGDTERSIYGEGMAADKAQFEQERDFPYKQTQYMQSLLQTLPLEAQQNYYAEPNTLSQFSAGAGGIMDLYDQLFNRSGGTTGNGTTASAPVNDFEAGIGYP